MDFTGDGTAEATGIASPPEERAPDSAQAAVKNFRGFPYRGFPSGWFQVAWSGDVPAGGVYPLRYFGRDLVLYRGESGEAHVLDAICPHLGAHLGYGGHVQADDIVCPFHGWRWDASGTNVEVPYWSRTKTSCRIRSWEVREVNGVIFVWYDRRDRAPWWEPPVLPEHEDTEGYFPLEVDGTRLWPRVRAYPQFIAENVVDLMHLKYVHKAAEPSSLEEFSADGACFKSLHRHTFGGDKSSTWLTPTGAQEGWVDIQTWGVGIVVARFRGTDESVHLQCQTPVEEDRCDVRVAIFVRRSEPDELEPSDAAKRRRDLQFREVDKDLLIWEHQEYIVRPHYHPLEAKAFKGFRVWTDQFYEGPADGGA